MAVSAKVAQEPATERATLVAQAMRIGLLALQDAGASLDVDVVCREFEGMARQTEPLNERVTQQVDEVLRRNFADGEGRSPRTLETFLGDRGQLRTSTRETDTEVDTAAVHEALQRVRAELDNVRGLKTKRATIGTAAKAVNAGLDQLLEGIVARIAEAESELCVDAGTPQA
jgi:hypothetical protein